MHRLRLLYAVSLAVLGALLVLAVVRPVTRGNTYTEVQVAQLVETPDEWIIQLTIINKGTKEMGHTVEVTEGATRYSQKVIIGDGRTFTHIRHIYREDTEAGQITFTVYRDDQEEPVERLTYHLADRG